MTCSCLDCAEYRLPKSDSAMRHRKKAARLSCARTSVGAPRRLGRSDSVGQFCWSDRFGRLASCGLRKDGALSPKGATELAEFVAPSLGFTDGAGTPTGLAKSPPSGATLTTVSSRVTGCGLAAPFGPATRCPLITARTSLIARAWSR